MIVLPVIERELRAGARHPITYNLRVLGALAMLSVLAGFWIYDQGGPGAGGRLFGDFHCTLFFAIWILVPALAADCISRERREGTLPLLFLTPLRASDIVYAKGFAQGWRSFMLWLAVLPIFTVCFLGGGVDWPELTMSILVNFSSVCLALGAGLLASARTRVFTRALATATATAIVLLCGLVYLSPFVMGVFYWAFNVGVVFPNLSGLSEAPKEGFTMLLDPQWISRSWLFRRGLRTLFCVYGTIAGISVFGLIVLARFAAWNVKTTWQQRPITPGALWLQERLFKPVFFRDHLRRWLRWQLERNPIGWLERRSWSGRLVIWSWLAIVICVYSSLFGNLSLYHRAFHFLQTILATLLAGSMAMTSAGSFRRERETGVLELLLVAPLREWEVLVGRLRGLWAQFLPAIILLCSVWLYSATFLSERSEVMPVVGFVVTFATVPVVGLYFSLAKSNFIVALVWTVLVQVVLPGAAASLAFNLDEPGLRDFLVPAAVQIVVASFLGWRLLVMLERRQFVNNVT